MPIYTYKHPETGEEKDILQSMNDIHEYKEGEVEWKRVFYSPNAAIDSEINPFDNVDFIDKTKNKKGTYGDLLDKAQELSEKRAESNGGVDAVKQKYFSEYSKTRKGAKHQLDKKSVLNDQIQVEF